MSEISGGKFGIEDDQRLIIRFLSNERADGRDIADRLRI
jgi:hypothetical protein